MRSSTGRIQVKVTEEGFYPLSDEDFKALGKKFLAETVSTQQQVVAAREAAFAAEQKKIAEVVAQAKAKNLATAAAKQEAAVAAEQKKQPIAQVVAAPKANNTVTIEEKTRLDVTRLLADKSPEWLKFKYSFLTYNLFAQPKEVSDTIQATLEEQINEEQINAKNHVLEILQRKYNTIMRAAENYETHLKNQLPAATDAEKIGIEAKLTATNKYIQTLKVGNDASVSTYQQHFTAAHQYAQTTGFAKLLNKHRKKTGSNWIEKLFIAILDAFSNGKTKGAELVQAINANERQLGMRP